MGMNMRHDLHFLVGVLQLWVPFLALEDMQPVCQSAKLKWADALLWTLYAAPPMPPQLTNTGQRLLGGQVIRCSHQWCVRQGGQVIRCSHQWCVRQGGQVIRCSHRWCVRQGGQVIRCSHQWCVRQGGQVTGCTHHSDVFHREVRSPGVLTTVMC